MTERTCSVSGCPKPVRFRGWCGAHHQRVLRHGNPLAHIPLRGSDPVPGALWCSACATVKPAAEFWRNASTRTGRDGVCTACVQARRERQRARRAAARAAYRKANRDRINAAKRASYHRNPAASNAAGREWRRRNPERVREQIRAQNAARYALTKNAPGHASVEQVAARWAYYGGKCWMCGQDATDTDHVKPLAKGGSNWPANLRPACRSCNRAKSGKWPLEEVTRGRATTRRQGASGAA